MTVKKRGSFWRYTFNEGGQRFWVTLNGKRGNPLALDDVEAKYQERNIRMQIRAGTYRKDLVQENFGRVKAPQTFEQFFDQIYMPYARDNKKDWQHDRTRGAVLKKFFGHTRITEVTPMKIVDYIKQRRQSTTIRKRLRSTTEVYKEVQLASSVFNMAINEGVARINPCRQIPLTVKRMLSRRNNRDRVLTRDEEEHLLAYLSGRRSHIAPLVQLALETGLRKGELCSLEINHVNISAQSRFFTIEGRKIEVRPNELVVVRSKTGKPRTVPLTEKARRIIENQIADLTNTKYLFTSAKTGKMIYEIKRAFTGAIRDAGLEDFRFHDLRHTFASRLNESGADPFTIRDILGHSSTTMTASYTHTSSELRLKAIEAMNKKRVIGITTELRQTA